MTFDIQRIRDGRETNGVRRVLTPEGVEVEFTLATRAQRLLAVTIDVVVQIAATLLAYAAVVLLFAAMTGVNLNGVQFLNVVLLMASFFFQFFYFMSFEVFWQGKTPGKHVMGLRVVGANGQPLALRGLVVRNFMRQVELFLPLSAGFGLVGQASPLSSLMSLAWAVGLSAYIWFDADRRRLGDLMGGTIVVVQPVPRLLPDVAASAQAQPATFRFTAAQMETYGRFELQVLEEVLRQGQFHKDDDVHARIVERIASKIGYESEIAPALHEAFLNDFYAAQRQHLEREALYGKRKESKADDTDQGSSGH